METVYSLTTRNYKVSATVGVTTVVQTPVRAILDTGAGPNLVREAVLPEDWQCRRLTGEPECRIVGAGGRKLRQKGIIILLVQVGQLRLKTKFIVVEELAAECILGCQFINRHVQTKEVSSRELAFSPDRLHNRPEAARYLLTLVTACSDRETHTLSNFS